MSVPEAAETTTGEQPRSAANMAALHRAAWLSVGLGLLVEVLVVIALFTFDELGEAASVIADGFQRITWPILVCVALAFAQTMNKVVGGSAARAMGVVGLLAAPLAITLTRIAQKGIGSTLGAADSGLAIDAILVLSLLRAAQYGALGATLGRLQDRGKTSVRLYVLAGLAAGVVFGGATLLVSALMNDGPESTGKLVAGAVNELVVPVGCALILFATNALAERLNPG